MKLQVGGHALLHVETGVSEPIEIRLGQRLLRRIAARGGKRAGARLEAVPNFVKLVHDLGGVPYLKLAAVASELTLFALNRDLTSEMRLEVTARGFDNLVVVGATTLHDPDLKAANTRDAPDRIRPVALAGISMEGGAMTATSPPASWSVIRLAPAGA